MAPRKRQLHHLEIDPAYLAELRARVERAGVMAVAKAARMNRKSVWRVVAEGRDQRVTLNGVERLREALNVLEPRAEPVPPPVVAVRGRVHFGWIALADKLSDDEIERLTARVRPTLSAGRRKRSRK